jgi:hypothetical protein
MAKKSNSDKVRYIDAGNFEIPEDYFELNKIQRDAVCLILVKHMFLVIEKEFNPEFNKIDIINSLITHTITSHEKEEKYEICQVLKDVKKIVDEFSD